MGWFFESPSEREDRLNDCNRDGQLDGQSGKNNPPHDINVSTHMFFRESTIEKLKEDNESYEAGRQSTAKR